MAESIPVLGAAGWPGAAAYILRGQYRQNMTKFKRKILLIMKYQHVADVIVEIYSCATCVKRV